MDLTDKKIGFALTGSHCTLDAVFPAMEKLTDQGASVVPIFSNSVQEHVTRFGNGKKWSKKVKDITGQEALKTIVEAEPIGPKELLDLLIVAPCTGNSMAKIANGITDTPVTMAVKAHLRNSRPVILAISTNDALGNNAKNIGFLINSENIYLVPLGQDKPRLKPDSLVARMDLIVETVKYALQGKQIQPVIIEYKGV